MDCVPARLNELPAAQRAIGRLALGFGTAREGAPTRIVKFYQEGCLKARLPRPANAAVCDAITMNISGGIAGGDQLHTAIELGEGARVCLASAAAERVYRAQAGRPARLNTNISLGPGAALAHLPQETILFDGFALNRTLSVSMAADASYLGVESLIFGRQAMGESVTAGRLRDTITVRRGGRLVVQDMTRLESDIAGLLGRPAVAAGNIATANIIYAAPGAPRLLETVRAALAHAHAGASLVQDVLRVRILAPSASALRRLVAAVVKLCRDGAAMPPVWQM